jgi:DNA-binding CsgD family transcriptional regulator
MVQLDERRLRSVIAAGADLATAPDLDALRLTSIDAIRGIVACDHASYNEIGAGRPPLVLSDPGGPLAAEDAEVFGRLAHQNPLIAHHAATGDGQALRLSDLVSQRELRRLELHRLVYGPLEINYQTAVATISRSGSVVGVALSRRTADFDDRDLAALELIRPQLVAAFDRLTELDWAQRMLAAVEDRGEEHAVVLVDDDGTLLRMSSAAVRLLDMEPPERLPSPLREWLADDGWDDPAARARPFAHRGGHLHARRRRDRPGDPISVVFTIPLAERSRAGALALGLTRREAELMALLVAGENGFGAAAALGISPRTVDKHLEHVYRRLEVGSRAEAIRAVLAAAREAGEVAAFGD